VNGEKQSGEEKQQNSDRQNVQQEYELKRESGENKHHEHMEVEVMRMLMIQVETSMKS
jgi:hypothetical protein